MKNRLKKSNLINVFIYMPAVCLLLLLGWYCKREAVPGLSNEPDNTEVNVRTDCAAFLSYESETTTYGKLINTDDASKLKPEDHLLMMPHRERYRVEACYKSTGAEEITVTYLTPINPIIYGENVADASYKPDYSKVVLNLGTATYYDQYGAVMRTGYIDQEQGLITRIVEAAGQRNIPDQAIQDKIFELLKQEGVTTEKANSDFATIRVNNPDGSYTQQVIDKKTLTLVGNFAYSKEGVLETRLLMNMDGTAQNPILKTILFESTFQAVSSPDIPVRLVQHSTIDNFTFTTN